jgi:hypothetical protein
VCQALVSEVGVSNKVGAVCAAVRAALEARAAGGLLADRWELVILSTYARSEPPDLGAALSRIGRRREAEIATGTSGDSNPTGAVDSAAALKHLITLIGGRGLRVHSLHNTPSQVFTLVPPAVPGSVRGDFGRCYSILGDFSVRMICSSNAPSFRFLG